MVSDMEDVRRPSHRQCMRYTGHTVRISFLASVATLPFVLYHCQIISTYSFITSILVIPLTSFWIMPCILMAFITMPSGLDAWFIDGAGAGMSMAVRIAEEAAALPLSIFYVPAMPLYSLIAAVCGGLWLCLMRQGWRYAGLLPIAIALLYPLYTIQPDFTVTADGRAWAARLKDGRLAVSSRGPDRSDIQIWQKRFGYPELIHVDELPDSSKQLRCDELGCVYHHGPALLAMPVVESAALEDCERVSVVIAPFVIKGCAAGMVIDGPQLWMHGSEAIYFSSGIINARHERPRPGVRPWSPGWKGNIDRD